MSRTLRSRSRSRAPAATEAAAAAADAAAAASSSSHSHSNGSSRSSSDDVSPSRSGRLVGGLSREDLTTLPQPHKAYDRPGVKKFEPKAYYWCDSPDLDKVAAHLDKLTASDLQLRAVADTLRTSIGALESSVAGLSDANARLKRELREQKLRSNRRWILATLLLVAYTYGQSFVSTVLALVAWALHSPEEFFPALMDQVGVMSTWLLVAAFPLLVLLFLHKLLRSFHAGRLSLARTAAYSLAGVLMQIPLLYFLLHHGLVALADLRRQPLFATSGLNHAVTVAVASGLFAVDYSLVVMHKFID